jgi:hypothetical protein
MDIYEVNFAKIKRNVNESTFKNILKLACDFKYNHIIFDRNKLKKPKFNYLDRIRNKISSTKLIYSDIFINIVMNLNIKKFYNNYYVDFRGRQYPSGTFNYLNPRARNFISYSYNQKLTFSKCNESLNKDYATSNILIEQLLSYFRKPNNDAISKELATPTIPSLSFILNYKPGTIFYIKKLLFDLKGLFFPTHPNYHNKCFSGFFGLDASSSGLKSLLSFCDP